MESVTDHFSALEQKKTMLVGHNLFLDLVYFYKCFFGPLPKDVKDFIPLLQTMFPVIFDTKYLADDLNNNSPTYKSSLEDIVQEMECSDEPSPLTGKFSLCAQDV